jgi:hypothetical protein
MSATLTTYGRKLVLSRTFLPSSSQALTTLFVALTSQPAYLNSTGSDLTVIEPPANFGYVRQAYGIGDGFWQFGTGTTLVSTKQVIFPAATGGDWNWISGWALVSDVTGGNIVMSGALKQAVTVYAGDQVFIAVGGISVALYG